jgi:hypothetical protein
MTEDLAQSVESAQDTADTPLPPTAPALPAGFDMKQFAEMLGLAIQQGTAGAIEQTKPRRASRDDWEYERKSAYNRLGEKDHPRPGLTVPTFWGVLDDSDPSSPYGSKAPIPLYEIESAQTTYEEQALLNQLVQSRGTLEMNDGEMVPYEVYVQKDRATQQPAKRIIALPKARFEKATRNSLPPLKRLAKELLERQEAVA